jgi:hypothetical protein
LVLKQKFPKKWDVYKNNKHIGIFKGNASMSIENDILDNLE